jgi:hypothetical protein
MESANQWIFSLQPVGDKQMMRRTLTTASSRIGDMPAVGPTLRMAYNALKGTDAAVKRIVIISDGDPAAPTAELLSQLKDAGVSVSTVCIAPHSPNDEDMLAWIALKTGGQFYSVTSPTNLPQIFTREAATVKRGILIEKPFEPKPKHESELLTGLARNPFPKLRGYVVTTPKNKAVVPLVSHEDDPVLAHWRYGLGKSVAFTADVTNRWASDWLKWEGFNRFWAQTVRWAMRQATPSNFRVETRIKDGMGYIRIDAVDEKGRFVNFLRPKATVVGPAPDFMRQNPELNQTGPGIYEAAFPVNRRGAYMINLTYETGDGAKGMIQAGLSLSYSREYEHHTTNYPLLENIAAASGGKVLDVSDNPFRHDLKVSPDIAPVWQYLALLAALLFPADIFVRRVAVDFAAAYAVLAAQLRRIPGLSRMGPEPIPRTEPVTGRYGAARSADTTPELGVASPTFGMPLPADSPTLPEGEEQEVSTVGDEAEPGAEYTKRLLEAKKRARARRKSRGGQDGSQEET